MIGARRERAEPGTTVCGGFVVLYRRGISGALCRGSTHCALVAAVLSCLVWVHHYHSPCRVVRARPLKRSVTREPGVGRREGDSPHVLALYFARCLARFASLCYDYGGQWFTFKENTVFHRLVLVHYQRTRYSFTSQINDDNDFLKCPPSMLYCICCVSLTLPPSSKADALRLFLRPL